MKFFKKKTIYRLSSNDTDPYLIRWNIFECKWFSIKIHKILRSDDDCLHDHPWAFVSIILKGGYVEQSYKEGLILSDNASSDDLKQFIINKKYRPGSILFRPALYRHRLVVQKTAWTLVITTRKVRQWGFWTPKGWLPWFKYSQNDHCY